MGERYLTVAEAARILGVGIQTVYRMVWAREITWLDVSRGGKNRRIRIPESAIRAYVKSRLREAVA